MRMPPRWRIRATATAPRKVISGRYTARRRAECMAARYISPVVSRNSAAFLSSITRVLEVFAPVTFSLMELVIAELSFLTRLFARSIRGSNSAVRSVSTGTSARVKAADALFTREKVDWMCDMGMSTEDLAELVQQTFRLIEGRKEEGAVVEDDAGRRRRRAGK